MRRGTGSVHVWQEQTELSSHESLHTCTSLLWAICSACLALLSSLFFFNFSTSRTQLDLRPEYTNKDTHAQYSNTYEYSACTCMCTIHVLVHTCMYMYINMHIIHVHIQCTCYGPLSGCGFSWLRLRLLCSLRAKLGGGRGQVGHTPRLLWEGRLGGLWFLHGDLLTRGLGGSILLAGSQTVGGRWEA